MKTITQFAALALAFTLSIGSTLAQQPVRRPVAKTATRPTSSATGSSVSQAKKPTVATTAAAKPQPQAQQAPAPETSQAPVVTRQAEARPQPVAHTAPSRTYAKPSRNSISHPLYLNAGVGLATYYGGGFPIGVSLEAGVKNNFSVGGSIDYFHYNYGYYSGGYNFVLAGVRASYHLGDAFGVQDANFDPYIGATLGFRYAHYSDSYGYSYSDYGSGYNSGLWLGIHVGARYFFSPKVGAFAEVGYGVSALKLGLAAKF